MTMLSENMSSFYCVRPNQLNVEIYISFYFIFSIMVESRSSGKWGWKCVVRWTRP